MKTHIAIILMTAAVFAGTIFLIVDNHRATQDEVIRRFHAQQFHGVRHLVHEMDQYLRDRSQGAQVLSTLASVQHHDMKKMAADVDEYFEYMKKQYVEAISVYDEKGTIIYSTAKDAIGRNYANCDFARWAAKKENKGKLFISSLIRAAANQSDRPPYFRFVIAAPVYQEARDSRYPKRAPRFGGVLTITIDLEELITALLPLLDNNTTKQHVWIMDTSGTVLFQSEHPEIVPNSIRKRDETCMQCHVSFDYVEKVLAQKEGTIEYALRERPKKSAAFAHLTFENAAWIIVVNVPLQEVSGFLARQLVQTFLLIGLITVALAGASALIYRSNRFKIRAQEEAKQWREKRELEDRIRKSEEHYRQLVEISPDAIAVHCEGKIVFVNPAAVRLLGATGLNELIGRHALEIVHPDDREMVKQRIAEMLQGRECAPMVEERFLRMDGSIVDVEVVAAPTTYQGKPAVQVVIRDITERKLAEEVMRKKDEHHRAVVENIFKFVPEGLLVFTESFNLLKHNKAFEEIVQKYAALLGCAEQELTERILEQVRSKIERGDSKEIHIRRKDQSRTGPPNAGQSGELILQLNAAGIFLAEEEEEEEARIVVSLLDVTERKQAEEALGLSENLFRSIWESSKDGMRLTDANGLMVRVNQAFCDFVSKPRKELEGNSLVEIYTESERERILSSYLENYSSSELRPYLERKFKLWNGEEVWFAVTNALLNSIGAHPLVLSIFRDITERKRAEEQIAMLAHALRSISECVSITDMDDRLLFVNEGFLKTYGYEEHELLGNHISIVRSPKSLPDVVREILPATLRGGWQGELLNRRKDGSEFPIFLSTSVVRDDNGQPLALIGVATDITERKRAEEALKESEQRYRSLTESAITGVYLIQEGLFRYVNPILATVFGYRVDEIVNKLGPLDLTAPDDRNVVTENIRKRVEGEAERIRYSFKGLRKDGRQIEIEVHGARIEYNGKPAIIGTLLDITERKQAEEALRASEAKYRSLFENVLEGIFQSTANGRLLTANPALVRMLGYESEEELKRVDIARNLYVNPAQREAWAQELEKEGVIQNVELTLKRKDGKHITVLENAHVVRNEQGAVLYYEGTLTDITERKQAERALQESEERFRNLVENITDVFYVSNAKGQLLYCSPNFFAETGYSPDEVLGRSYVRFIDPDDRRRVVDHYLKQAASGTVDTRCELKVRRKDGTHLWAEQVTRIVRDDAGNVVEYRNVTRNITQRRLLEQVLRESEEKFRTVAETAASAIFIYQDEYFRYVNPSAEILTGYTADELVTMRFWDVVHPDHRDMVRERGLARQRMEDVPARYQFKILMKNGETRWLDFAAGVIQYQGQAAGLGTAIDITDRKIAEQALLESEERHRRFFEEDLTADTLVTTDGTLVMFNPAYVEMFGFASNEQAMRTKIAALWPSPEKWLEFLSLLKRQRTLKYRQLELRRCDGRPVYVIANVVGIFDAQGELKQLQSYLFNDTPRRLLEDQLQQAQKLESLGTLASGIAHDFNNILGIILGHASLLEHISSNPEKLARSIDAISKATQRGALVVRQLLTFARKHESVFESVKVNEIIVEITKLIQETFPKTIELKTNLKADLPYVVADATQIHQVLLNLCVNARDAMPKGGTLSITSTAIPNELVGDKHPEATAREYVRIEVRDTGAGMNETVRQRLFEPFFTTKGVGKGTGLGLAVVYGIIESHHGFIEVESAVGKGTTMTVYLPVAEPNVLLEEMTQHPVRGIAGGTETVLLIEDEKMLVGLLRAALASHGYNVLTAQDGEEGVRTYAQRKNEIAVVICDLGLPKIGGEEVFKNIRALNPNAKVVLASGFIDPDLKSELYKAGVRQFIQKPYVPDAVLRLIREVLDAAE